MGERGGESVVGCAMKNPSFGDWLDRDLDSSETDLSESGSIPSLELLESPKESSSSRKESNKMARKRLSSTKLPINIQLKK